MLVFITETSPRFIFVIAGRFIFLISEVVILVWDQTMRKIPSHELGVEYWCDVMCVMSVFNVPVLIITS